jgi:hypothetical protein
MSLIALLIGLIVFGVIFYALNNFGIPDPWRKIGNLVVGLIFLLWLVGGLLGGFGGLENIRIGR